MLLQCIKMGGLSGWCCMQQDHACHHVTWSYLMSIKNLTHDQLVVIFDDAKQFMKAVQLGGSKSSQAEMDPEDEHAFLAESDGSDGEQSQAV